MPGYITQQINCVQDIFKRLNAISVKARIGKFKTNLALRNIIHVPSFKVSTSSGLWLDACIKKHKQT